ncbi:MAG: hemerythrin domain-containing protein [Candidatus Parvarchaeota archaeon]|nr:hemerythrin domain-containing protein [Candidatus Parvarchaeota archaeon]
MDNTRMISSFLENEHKRYSAKLSEIVADLRGGSFNREALRELESDVKCHIYVEETLLFPRFSYESRRELNGLEMEHGAIWKLFEIIEKAFLNGDIDLALRRSESLGRVFNAHSTAEENLAYKELDSMSGSNFDFLSVKKAPYGWVCRILRKE